MPSSPGLALGLAFLLACAPLSALHAKESIRLNGSDARRAGASYPVGGWWFQYLGKTDAGDAQWLFPHLDGVPEIFEAPGGGRPGAEWTGAFGSRFDPRSGRFENLFSAAEVLNEFLRPGLDAPQRRVRARLLNLWIALHGGEENGPAPHWLAEYAKDLAPWTSPDDETWLKNARAYCRDAYAKVAHAGTELPAFAAPFDTAQGPAAYHRAMLRDGYLDVALVGGNLYDKDNGLFKSWLYMENFCERLKQMGFREAGFRGSREETFLYKPVKILGQPVVVRVNATGGSTRDYRIRRGVANFEEGLAHADVFLYHGHSNLMEGSYWVSETNDEYSRFRIGLDDQSDLGAKCHSLKRRAYQFAGLQSCSSFQKYARPILRYYADELKDAPGATGFLGTADFCYHVDLVPRYSALLEGLFAAEGPRTILERINALKPMPQSPPIIARGFLQPRFTFVVPQGVTIANVSERDAGNVEPLMLTDGEGSDGRGYVSTECFPQDAPGEIVQLVEMPGAVFGLARGGRVYEVSERTKGAPEPARFAKRDAAFTYLARVTDDSAPALVLLGRDGKVYARVGEATNGEKLLLIERQAPGGTTFDLIGEADDGTFVARASDAAGAAGVAKIPARWFAWDAKAKRYAPLDAAPKLRNEAPSLTVPGSSGARGALWQPKR